MGYTIKNIEDAILAELQGDADLAAACKTISAYGGQIADLLEESPRLIINAPAIYVVYTGSSFVQAANQDYDDDMAFSIVVITRDLRGRENMKNGMYEILEFIKACIIANDLGMIDIEPMRPERIQALFVSDKLSIYGFDIATYLSVE